MYLALVDAYSKLLSVEVMQTMTTVKTIQKFHAILIIHRILYRIATDTGTTFYSKQFQTFMKDNAIKLIFLASYQPSSNNLAERVVQTVKQRYCQVQEPESI